MSIAAQHLAHLYTSAYGAGRMNLRGVSEEAALEPPLGGGHALGWIVGHIVHTRMHVHGLLGIDVAGDPDVLEPYGRGTTDPSEADAVDLRTLLSLWKASQAALDEAFGDLGDTDLEAPLEEAGPRFGETVGTALAFMAFHEAYHVGQLGLTRRRLGLGGAIA